MLVPICSWRHAQALGTAFLAEEHAGFLVSCFGASSRATGRTLLRMKAALSDTMHGKAVCALLGLWSWSLGDGSIVLY